MTRVVRGDQRPTPVVRILNATPDLLPTRHSPPGISAPSGSKCSLWLPSGKLTSPLRPISLRSPAAFFLSMSPPDHRSGSATSRLARCTSQLALRSARAGPERGARHHRVLIPSLHVTAFRPSRFKARGGTCQFCRARPTPYGNLSLPCGDCPFWGPPQQNQRSRSTASAFDRTAKRPVRPLDYPAHFPVDSGVVRISARDPLPPV
jgi:hypothetical protein